MTDVERYITDDLLFDTTRDFDEIEIGGVLRAVLPTILARHRADVLREAADAFYRPHDTSISENLRRMADEAGGR